MVVLLSKYKTTNTAPLLKWNKLTFKLRQSMGLIAIRTYTDIQVPDEFYAISYWDELSNLKEFKDHESVQRLFSGHEFQWSAVLAEEEKGSMGQIVI